MFTGIVEAMGLVTGFEAREGAWRLTVKAGPVVNRSRVGDSVAVNGACLTVVERSAGLLAFALGPETLKATALSDLVLGDRVNLERPARLGAPLGGHLVLGHVDGVGTLATVIPDRDTVRARIRVPEPSLMRYLIPKGSVAVDGVSLTVAALDEESFEVMLIPHTLAVTTLGKRAEGARVNLEMDVIGKYLYRFSQDLLRPAPQRSVE
ncbi:MAG: riboflavin synthase [candidate division NC10 bacterium]